MARRGINKQNESHTMLKCTLRSPKTINGGNGEKHFFSKKIFFPGKKSFFSEFFFTEYDVISDPRRSKKATMASDMSL